MEDHCTCHYQTTSIHYINQHPLLFANLSLLAVNTKGNTAQNKGGGME